MNLRDMRPALPNAMNNLPTKEQDITIRPKTIQDYTDIRRVRDLAFGRPDEARIIDALTV